MRYQALRELGWIIVPILADDVRRHPGDLVRRIRVELLARGSLTAASYCRRACTEVHNQPACRGTTRAPASGGPQLAGKKFAATRRSSVLCGDDMGVSAEPDPRGAPRTLLALYDEALPVVYGYFVRRCGDRGTAEDLEVGHFPGGHGRRPEGRSATDRAALAARRRTAQTRRPLPQAQRPVHHPGGRATRIGRRHRWLGRRIGSHRRGERARATVRDAPGGPGAALHGRPLGPPNAPTRWAARCMPPRHCWSAPGGPSDSSIRKEARHESRPADRAPR